MAKMHIVTDSSARFVSSHFLEQHPVTVLPNKLEINGQVYREGVDISVEDALQLIAKQPTPPKVIAPAVAEYADLYSQLISNHDAVISIHSSRELFKNWENARTAVQRLGHCPVMVMDSRMIDAAQGILVQIAARAVERGESLEDIVRDIRGAIERLYAVYYVESVDYLLQSDIMSESHTILGRMLGVKPFLTIENGEMTTIEKVRTRSQAIEHLVEFVVEFVDIEETAILQHKPYPTEQTRMLQERLKEEFPGQPFPQIVYSATLAALIGADATGVVVLEREMDEFNDDF